MTHPIYSCLWFDNNLAKTAAEYYCSIFKDSKILEETPVVVRFELNGTQFMGLNGGPQFKFSEAVSFGVSCDTQEEIDYYWDKLGNGGELGPCGWLKDRFGISWQIVPSIIGELMKEPDRSARVMDVLMKMQKLDIEQLVNA